MDATANLREQEEILGLLSRRVDDQEYLSERRRRLRELRDALRAWLAAGGDAPDWQAYPRARLFYEERH